MKIQECKLAEQNLKDLKEQNARYLASLWLHFKFDFRICYSIPVLYEYRLKSGILIKKGEIEGSFTSSEETPAAIAEEYVKLFSNGRRSLVKNLKSDELTGKILANNLFKVNAPIHMVIDTL